MLMHAQTAVFAFFVVQGVSGVVYNRELSGGQADDSRRGSSTPMLGCKELRSKRYISDGQCTSARPLVEVVCAGACLPLDQLPWYSNGSPTAAAAGGWRCEPGAVRLKRVHLLCPNGERQSYRVPVVRACKCVRNLEHATHGS